ncbi:MAG: TonB-dependent receptor [candidate division KSB1 bacterium]|nr:TonB-dependent receptor [candidate division KSB1 bacterium]MDZ7300567.1 TonB-dependent receptor [candidate division KSB1 bacterium]
MRKKLQWTAICLLLLFVLVQVAGAGTTGKIAGRVLEKGSNAPLPGANVTVVGTTMGAATDLNGQFTILHVPPGVYAVEASMIGYAKIRISDVRVYIDQTTRVDFELETETLVGQEITVVAAKSVVKEDVATSVAALSGDEVKSLPFSNINQIAGLQAGVRENLTIRGGGAEEALIQLDGITLRDPRNNQPIAGIPLSSIQEFSIERGGFNAEYGQVRSGIINVVTKEGSKTSYGGTVTLRYSPPHAKNFGISPFDRNAMWLRPYLDPAVAWNGTENGAWDIYTQKQYPRFDGWNAISHRLLTDADPTNDLSPQAAQRLFLWEHRRRPVTDQPDYNIDAGFGGPVPAVGKQLGDLRFFASFRRQREMLLIPLSRDDYLDYDWSLQLTSDISPTLKLKVSGLTGKSYNVAINSDPDWQYFDPENPNAFGILTGIARNAWSPTYYLRDPYRIAQVTWEQRPSRIFCDSWYSQATVQHYIFGAKLTHLLSPSTFYDAQIERVFRKYTTGPIANRNTTPIQEIVPGYVVDEAPFGYDPNPNTGITGMFFGGHSSVTRDSTKTSSIRLKFDLTSQVNFSNLLKTGFEFEYFDLNMNYGTVKPFFGEKTFVKRQDNPYRAALYVQDKLEAKGFILNVGLRLDYSNPNTEWIDVDPFNVGFYSAKFSPDSSYQMVKAKSDVSLSPRLSISHPITVNSKLFFNYGHFKQLPTYEQIFRVGRDANGKVTNIGDPQLALAKTISYELGYDHALFGDYLLQLAGFYHDIVDQQAFTTFNSRFGNVTYLKANNNSYEDIRGFEATLRKSTGRWWSGFANFTYQVNTAGLFGKASIFENPSEQRVYDRNTVNQYQYRPIPRPYGRLSLLFHIPQDYGPKIMGSKPLSGWEANFIADWQSGGYITWNPNSVRGISQNIKVKDSYDTVLRLNKTFSVQKMNFVFFVDIYNPFNIKRLSGASFYDSFDWQDYMSSLHLPASSAYNNIPGKDKAGDYRKDGIAFVPIEQAGTEQALKAITLPNLEPNRRVLGYVQATGQYWEYRNGSWQLADRGFVDQVLKDKAYIDMPNQTYFNFLNPRQIFLGIRTSFDF